MLCVENTCRSAGQRLSTVKHIIVCTALESGNTRLKHHVIYMYRLLNGYRRQPTKRHLTCLHVCPSVVSARPVLRLAHLIADQSPTCPNTDDFKSRLAKGQTVRNSLLLPESWIELLSPDIILTFRRNNYCISGVSLSFSLSPYFKGYGKSSAYGNVLL